LKNLNNAASAAGLGGTLPPAAKRMTRNVTVLRDLTRLGLPMKATSAFRASG
jgi:hypothetical protein